MKDLVVCTTDHWHRVPGTGPKGFTESHPVKGEIYTVNHVVERDKEDIYYHLAEFPKALYHFRNFRPTDQTFGPSIAENIQKLVESEDVEKLMV